MRHLGRLSLAIFLFELACPLAGLALPPCAYTPAESLFSQLTLQGNLRSERDVSSPSSLGGELTANFTRLFASTPSAYSLGGTADLSIGTTGPALKLNGSGDFMRFIEDDRFAVAALKVNYTGTSGLEIDLTGGLGVGRFRDVTPLAKAIRIQDDLLDRGILLAPFTDETLETLAQEIGRVGATVSDQLAVLEQAIVATGLVKGNALGARGLLAMENILASSGDARLCGWDFQARVGGAVIGLPSPTPSEVVALQARCARAPDPVSQWTASVQWMSGFSPLRRYLVTATLSYGRRVAEGFRLVATYDFTRDDQWSTPGVRYLEQDVTSTLTIQLSSGLNLAVNGKLSYDTRVGQVTSLLLVQLSYDVF